MICAWILFTEGVYAVPPKEVSRQEVIIVSLPKIADRPKLKLKETRFVRGWCTYYAALRRKQLGRPVTWHGNAGTWAVHAASQGYITGKTPVVGAIYVSTRENSRGSRAGHVAIVEDLRDGGIVVSEMNYKGFNRISTRFIPHPIAMYIY